MAWPITQPEADREAVARTAAAAQRISVEEADTQLDVDYFEEFDSHWWTRKDVEAARAPALPAVTKPSIPYGLS